MTVPAGWYDDGSGRQRWWDGAQWTEHFAPVEPAAPAPDAEVASTAETDAVANAAGASPEEFDLDATARREEIPRATAETTPEATTPAFTASADEAPAEAPTAEAPAYTPPAAPVTSAYAPPTEGNPAYMAPAYSAPAYAEVPQGPKAVSLLGFIGLGLAVLGTILACIPTLYTVIPGLVVLLAALVISIIALFKKGTQKWPGITGVALSVVGGIIGSIVLIVVLVVSAATAIVKDLPSSFPSPIATDLFESMDRPAPELIGIGYLQFISDQDSIEQYMQPGVTTCIGEHLYASDLSDATLWNIATGQPVDDADADAVQQASDEASASCLTQ